MGYEYYEMEDKPTERSRWTPLTRLLLSGQMTQERQQELSPKDRFSRWMINEGYSHHLHKHTTATDKDEEQAARRRGVQVTLRISCIFIKDCAGRNCILEPGQPFTPSALIH